MSFNLWSPLRSNSRRVGILVGMLTILYLVFEFAFNAHLLNTVSQPVSAQAINRLEILGRIMASIGLFVVIVHFAYKKHFKNGPSIRIGPILIFVGAVISVSILFFFGEKWVITTIADRFNNYEQASAYTAGILREGMALKTVSIKGLSYGGAQDEPSPSEKTLLAMIGLAQFRSSDLANEVSAHFEQISQAIVRSKIDDEGAHMYQEYIKAWNKLADQYRKEYLPASRKYVEGSGGNARAQAELAWVKINQELMTDGWPKYQSINQQFNQNVHQTAEKMQPKLSQFVKHRNECQGLQFCINRVDKQYDDMASKEFGTDAPPWTYWCDQLSKSAISIPFITGLPGGHDLRLDIGPKEKTDNYSCNTSVDHIEPRLRVLMVKQFSKREGFPVGLNNSSAFLASSAATHFVKEASLKQGINLPSTWSANDKSTWIQAAEHSMQNGAKSSWGHRIREKLGVYVPPNLPWSQFARSDGIKNLMSSKVGVWAEPGLTADQFASRILGRKVIDGAKRTADTYMEIRSGRNPVAGHDAVLAMIVPPIALVLSLFFALVNSLTLIIDSVIGILRYAFDLTGKSIQMKWWPMALKAIAWIVVIVVPMQFSNPVSTSSAFGLLQEQINQSTGMPVQMGINWLIRAEPAFYGIGSQFLSVIDGVSTATDAPIDLPTTGAPWRTNQN